MKATIAIPARTVRYFVFFHPPPLIASGKISITATQKTAPQPSASKLQTRKPSGNFEMTFKVSKIPTPDQYLSVVQNQAI